MNTHQLVSRLVSAGIDPASVEARVDGAFVRLATTSHPGLRPINERQLAVLRARGMPVKRVGVNQRAIGAARDPSFAHVYKGWNVWAVDQVEDLPFSLLMLGVSRDRQLQIWVEDQLRLHAPAAVVADPIDLKGSQVEILAAVPPDLSVDQTKEQVPGSVMLTDGASTFRPVRFFNRGEESDLPWPHDGSYILDRVYVPSPTSPATAGPGPGTITHNVAQPIGDATAKIVAVAAIGLVGYAILTTRKK